MVWGVCQAMFLFGDYMITSSRAGMTHLMSCAAIEGANAGGLDVEEDGGCQKSWRKVLLKCARASCCSTTCTAQSW